MDATLIDSLLKIPSLFIKIYQQGSLSLAIDLNLTFAKGLLRIVKLLKQFDMAELSRVLGD
jgi:hypothetical protein